MNDIRDLLKLPLEERLKLIDDLWDSIEAEDRSSLTDAQKAEIGRRLDDLEANPDDVRPWEEVRARLWSQVK